MPLKEVVEHIQPYGLPEGFKSYVRVTVAKLLLTTDVTAPDPHPDTVKSDVTAACNAVMSPCNLRFPIDDQCFRSQDGIRRFADFKSLWKMHALIDRMSSNYTVLKGAPQVQ